MNVSAANVMGQPFTGELLCILLTLMGFSVQTHKCHQGIEMVWIKVKQWLSCGDKKQW